MWKLPIVLLFKFDPELFKFELPLFLLLLKQLPLPALLDLHSLYLHSLLVDSIRFHLLLDLVLYLGHQVVHVHLLLHLLHSFFVIPSIIIIV